MLSTFYRAVFLTKMIFNIYIYIEYIIKQYIKEWILVKMTQVIVLRQSLCNNWALLISRIESAMQQSMLDKDSWTSTNETNTDPSDAFLSRTIAVSAPSMHCPYILLWVSVVGWTDQKENEAFQWDTLESTGGVDEVYVWERLNWLIVETTQCWLWLAESHLSLQFHQRTSLTLTNWTSSLCCRGHGARTRPLLLLSENLKYELFYFTLYWGVRTHKYSNI